MYHSKNPLNRFLHNKRLKIVKDLVLAKMSSMISWVKICLFYLKAVLGLERAHLNTKEKFGLIPKQNLKVLKVGAKNFYDYDATTYDHSRHPWINGYPGKVEADAILASMPRAKVILTSGAGTGRTVMNLVKRRKSEIIGLDISKNMIKKFKQKLVTSKLNSINLIVADAENLPFRNKIFDVVICSRAIKFFPHPVESLKESYRTLRNGGRIFVISETSDSLLYRMIHKISPRAVDPFDIRFSKSMLVSFFKEARIKIISIRPLISFPPLLYDAPKLILGILKKIDAKAGRYSHVWIIVGEKTC